MASRARVYLTQPIPERPLRRLQGMAEVTYNSDPLHIVSADEMAAGVQAADVLFCLLHDRVDASLLARNPGLRLIASMAIIPANIDVAAATSRGIPVTVIPPLVTEATADVTMALLLAVARRIVEGDRLVRSGVFPGGQSTHLIGGTVHGATLGIVGFGAIGRAVARRARGFGMRVVYMKRTRLAASEERDLGVEWAPLPALLADADFVSIHALETADTHHLIGAPELRQMKPSAYLINTSRGRVVDEAALVMALTEGWIAGAGLDVYEREPHVSEGLLGLANVVLEPHIGSADRRTRERIAGVVIDNIAAFLAGDRPPNVVNPEVYGG